MINNWITSNLGEITHITMGQSPSSSSYNEEGIGNYLIQGNADIKNRKSLPRQWTTEPTKLCEDGDILMTVRAPVGAIAKSMHNACIGRGVCSIKPKNVDKEFIYQFLLSYESKWKSLEQGSTFTAVNGVDIKTIQILLPPLPEQQKIAEILSTVDDKIEIIDQQITETQELKKGLMQRLLTKGIGHTEFKDSPLGKIPKSWEVVTINSIGNVITGSTPKTNVNEFYTEEGILWASPSDLTNVKYVNLTKKQLTPLGFEQTRKLPPKSILVTCIGSTIGKIGMTNSWMSSNQQINSIVCTNLNNSEFYYYVIENKADYIKSLAGTQAVPLLNKSDFSSILIIKPPIQEQQKIADILSSVDEKLEVLAEKKTNYQELKQGLMQQLLTGKIRVKV